MDIENMLNLFPLIQCEGIRNLFIITGSVIMTILLIKISRQRTSRLIRNFCPKHPILIAIYPTLRVEVKVVHVVDCKVLFVVSNLLDGVGYVDSGRGQILVSDCGKGA
jgi:hypothetical protein